MHIEPTVKLRVLVAEDSNQLRPAILRILQDTFEVVGAVSTGRELVDAALALGPDVIVSDLLMPGLSGLAAMQVLRGAGHKAPFVLLTVGVRNAHEWIEMGVLSVVDKSDLHPELVAAIHAAATGRVYLSRRASS